VSEPVQRFIQTAIGWLLADLAKTRPQTAARISTNTSPTYPPKSSADTPPAYPATKNTARQNTRGVNGGVLRAGRETIALTVDEYAANKKPPA